MPHKSSPDAIDVALWHCASEPVHTPGAIQSHGALMAFDNRSEEISFASSNIADVLNVPASALLSRRLGSVFARRTCAVLRHGLATTAIAEPICDLGALRCGNRILAATACAAGAFTIIELEKNEQQIRADLEGLDALVKQVEDGAGRIGLAAYFHDAVDHLQRLTGYDRVVVFRFDMCGSGEVIAERAAPGVARFCGLRFPAWDIPPQARALMLKTPVRIIANTRDTPSRLLAARPSLADLDMTHAVLRYSSLVHLEYLQNMGVQGSMTLNIVVQGRLWGMIAFHHRTPKLPSRQMRQLCTSFGQVFSRQLELRDHLDSQDRHGAASSAVMPHGNSFEVGDLTSVLEIHMRVMQADGAVLVRNNSMTCCGDVPENAAIAKVAAYTTEVDRPFVSSHLAKDAPEIARAVGPEFAGLLAVRFDADTTAIFLRRTCKRAVKWAGAPDQKRPTTEDAGGIKPRKSFLPVSTTVDDTSRPWSQRDICVAREIKKHIQSADTKNTTALNCSETSRMEAAFSDAAKTFELSLRVWATAAKWQAFDPHHGSDPERLGAKDGISGSEKDLQLRGKRCVFLTQDHAKSRSFAQKLRRLGFASVETETTVADALNSLQKKRADIVLVDVASAKCHAAPLLANLLTSASIPHALVVESQHDPDDQPVLFLQTGAIEWDVETEALARRLLRLLS